MTDTLSASPDAGWYDDPAGGVELRWWDGLRWTAATRERPSAARDDDLTEIAAAGVDSIPAPSLAELLREDAELDRRLHELGDDLPRPPRRRPDPVGPRRSTWAAAQLDEPDVGDRSSRTPAAWALVVLPLLLGVLLPIGWRVLPDVGFSPVFGVLLVLVVVHGLAALVLAVDGRELARRDWETLSPLWALSTVVGVLVARIALVHRQGGAVRLGVILSACSVVLGTAAATILALV
ncbi:DUF2510 domain-containing protein [Schumannella soli]|uniref:DUF2510 domain-containing protein n=1 Tax=Schumannella soli TaxID=2590779 RepID=A0A506Y3P2_9MICO|nr:DUF2510 domain-containing protein [Schumannella soli]TPW76047.1 DUF2510 domain-containing protein [Schumannella soli]